MKRLFDTPTGFLSLLVCFVLTAPAARGEEVPDAVIEEWRQHWTLAEDGAGMLHEILRVRLNNDRAYGDFADPRITYWSDRERVEVIRARTRMRDGRVLETPAYARNEVSPPGAAGWPAFAALRQLVLTLSGIEPGCVTELEYRVSRRAEAGRTLAADLRLQQRYPVVLRSVTVTVPVSTELASSVFGLEEKDFVQEVSSRDGGRSMTYTWEFSRLAAAVDEPLAPRWQQREPRLVFSTAGGMQAWFAGRVRALRVDEAEAEVAAAARKWTADASTPAQRVRQIQRRLADTLNFVEFDVAWRAQAPRSPGEVLASSYALPEEAAALLVALLRGAGVEARVAVLVAEETWDDALAHDGLVAAWVVQVGSGPDAEVWHPRDGRLERGTRWSGYSLIASAHTIDDAEAEDAATTIERRPAFPEYSADELSRCEIAIDVAIDAGGAVGAKASIALGGFFVRAESLRDGDAQREHARALLQRVLPGLRVEGLDVRRVAVGVFEAEARVVSEAPLKKMGERFVLALAVDGPAFESLPTPPWTLIARRLPVRWPGPFVETLDLRVKWPAGWTVDARPDGATNVQGPWGQLSQAVEIMPAASAGGVAASGDPAGGGLHVKRRIVVRQPLMDVSGFVAWREAMNTLRSERARTLLLKP